MIAFRYQADWRAIVGKRQAAVHLASPQSIVSSLKWHLAKVSRMIDSPIALQINTYLKAMKHLH